MNGYVNGEFLAEDRDEWINTFHVNLWRDRASMPEAAGLSEDQIRYVAERMFEIRLRLWNPVYVKAFQKAYLDYFESGESAVTSHKHARADAFYEADRDEVLQEMMKEFEALAWKAARDGKASKLSAVARVSLIAGRFAVWRMVAAKPLQWKAKRVSMKQG